MSDIRKSFAGVVALTGASLEVRPGEVHALIGQNGAGKSTLIKILTGVYRRDRGEIRLAGRSSAIADPGDARRNGISTIYQELNLVPLRSVTENVMLGYEPRHWRMFIDWPKAHRRTRDILTRFGIDIDIKAPLGEYATAIQQLVAIARAVSQQANLVIMDEPTSSLDDREVEVLFGVVRALRESGVSVLYVTHHLDELFRICDRVTVMRDGRSVCCKQIADTTKLELIADMLGRSAEEIRASGVTDLGGGEGEVGDALLQATDLATDQGLTGVNLTLRRGEIVGLGGLLGSGRTETARALFGVDPLRSGAVVVKGSAGPPAGPAAAIAWGIGYLTEDRKAEGILPDMSVGENLTLALLPRLTRLGRILRGRERELVGRFIRLLGIKAAGMDQPIRELSGGNQQKVLLARWLATEPDLLILDEPTRGVDVGAKLEIQTMIREYVSRGFGVVLASSELEELVEGADRIVVLRDGRSVTELTNPGITENALVSAIAHYDDENGDRGIEYEHEALRR